MKKSDKAGAQQPNLFLSGSTTQKNNVLSLADPEQFGRPLCDVPLFQTRTIPSPLATRTERDDASEIQTPSDLGTSSVSSAGTESSAFSWSRGSSKRKRHDGSKHGRHQQSPVPLSQSPCCTSCYVTETPKWRKGPLGPYTLCNVCGLLYAKKERKARSCRLRKEYSHNSFRDQTSDTS